MKHHNIDMFYHISDIRHISFEKGNLYVEWIVGETESQTHFEWRLFENYLHTTPVGVFACNPDVMNVG